jgi:hypothetical protein
MALSAFPDKAHKPSEAELKTVLRGSYAAWRRLIALVGESIVPTSEEWGYTSSSTGWGLRLRHKGRVLLYMTPGKGFFMASFALGERAVAAAHASDLPAPVLAAIDAAPRYAEGRGVRFEIRTSGQIPPILALVQIKNAH